MLLVNLWVEALLIQALAKLHDGTRTAAVPIYFDRQH